MPTINKLPAVDVVSSGDQIPVYAPNLGDARRMSVGTLSQYIEDNVIVPNNAANVTYDPAGTGAVQRTVEGKLRETVSVKDFGAVGDGVTDDARAIDAAVKAVYDAGGGTVYIPKGTYLLGTTTTATANPYYIFARNNVSIIGDGIDATVLKVKAGENLRFRGTTGPFVIATDQAAPLTNCRFSDFTVDWNGANNLLIQDGTGSPPETKRNNASVFSLRGGINIVCERIKVKETPGNQCIFFPAQSNLGQRNIVVRDCIFENNGSALAGNYNMDHSSVYCNGDYLLYENNTFRNDDNPTGFMACYEIHGSYSMAVGNKSEKYDFGFWIGSDFESIRSIKVIGDQHSNIKNAFALSAPNYAIDQVEIQSCVFNQRAGVVGITYPNWFVNGYATISCDRMAIENCEFNGQGYSQGWMQHLRIRDLIVSNNKIRGFASYGIVSGNVDLGGGVVIDNLIVQGNVWENVNQAIYFNSAALTAGGANGAVLIQNNTFNRTSPDANPVITTSFASSRGRVDANTFSSNYSTLYAGTPNGLAITDPTALAYTPTISGGSTAGVGTYTKQVGRYVLNGKLCTVFFDLSWSAHTGSGQARISLPFAAASTGLNAFGSLILVSYSVTAGATEFNSYVGSGLNYLLLGEQIPGGAFNNLNLDAAASAAGTITYEIA